MTSRLLIHPSAADAQGVVQRITPRSAGWSYVGFEARDLADGMRAAGADGANETCLVLVGGCARLIAGGEDFGVLGSRAGPFAGGPHALYVPPRMPWQAVAEGPVELAICASPAKGGLPARAIGPEEAGELTRGTGSNARLVRNILPDTAPAETLLVVEVITPVGTGRAIRRTSTTPTISRARPISRRPTTIGSPAAPASRCSGCIPRTARSTRRWRSPTAMSCWCRRAIIRSARRTASISTT